MGMTEQDLDNPNIGAALQQMGGKAMPKGVGRDALVDPGTLSRRAASRLKRTAAYMTAGLLAGEQP